MENPEYSRQCRRTPFKTHYADCDVLGVWTLLQASAFLQAEVVPYWERTKSPVGLPASDGQAQAANALTTTGRRTSKVKEVASEACRDRRPLR